MLPQKRVAKLAVLLLMASIVTAANAQPDQRVGPDERRALMEIFVATNGQEWCNNAGWGLAAGTECEWYGVECQDSHVVGLRLEENGLVGEIPSEAVELKWLSSAWLWQNKLAAVPNAWLEREDRGEFDLRLWNNPLRDHVTEISIESNQGYLLCSHAMLRIRDETIEMASVECRNETEDDRRTYCELRRYDTHGVSGLRRLARFVDKQGFYNLNSYYTVSQTHAGTTTVRITRNGRQKVVEDYGYLEPLELFGIQSAIWGAAPLSWDVVEKKDDTVCQAFFRNGNETIVTGLTFLLQLPSDCTDDQSGVDHHVIRDAGGELLIVDGELSKLQPVVLPDVALTSVTLNAGPAMQHERSANGLATREVILKGDILIPGSQTVPEAAAYTRIRYVNLPPVRAKVADSIIDTLRSFSWR